MTDRKDGGAPVLALSSNTLWSVLNFRSGLIRALIAAGYRVVVICPDGPRADAIADLGAEFVPIAIDPRGTSPVRDLATFRDFRRALIKAKADAFLGFTIKPNVWGTMAAKTFGIPSICNVTGLGAMYANRSIKGVVARALYRNALSRADVVMFQNQDDATLLASEVNLGWTEILPGSGVDLGRFRPMATPEREGPVRYLMSGRLLWDKGVAEFVDAARKMKAKRSDVEFQLAGFIEPPSDEAVPAERLASWDQEGIVCYLGAHEDIRPLYAAADCIVLPTYYREGVPRTLLEASAMGKAVITTERPGCCEAVDDGSTGILCLSQSADSLTLAMTRIADLNKAERAAMGRAGRAKMEREFDERFVHETYLAALVELGVKGS